MGIIKYKILIPKNSFKAEKKKKKEDYWPHRCNQMLTFPHGIKLFKKAFLPFPWIWPNGKILKVRQKKKNCYELQKQKATRPAHFLIISLALNFHKQQKLHLLLFIQLHPTSSIQYQENNNNLKLTYSLPSPIYLINLIVDCKFILLFFFPSSLFLVLFFG